MLKSRPVLLTLLVHVYTCMYNMGCWFWRWWLRKLMSTVKINLFRSSSTCICHTCIGIYMYLMLRWWLIRNINSHKLFVLKTHLGALVYIYMCKGCRIFKLRNVIYSWKLISCPPPYSVPSAVGGGHSSDELWDEGSH